MPRGTLWWGLSLSEAVEFSRASQPGAWAAYSMGYVGRTGIQHNYCCLLWFQTRPRRESQPPVLHVCVWVGGRGAAHMPLCCLDARESMAASERAVIAGSSEAERSKTSQQSAWAPVKRRTTLIMMGRGASQGLSWDGGVSGELSVILHSPSACQSVQSAGPPVAPPHSVCRV
jgi:hypothetical protein